MSSIRQEKIQAISLSGSTLTLPGSPSAPNQINVGGQGYRLTSTLSLTLAGLTAGTTYFIYVIPSGGTLVLTTSANVNSIGPSGSTSWRMVGQISALTGSTAYSLMQADAATNVVAAKAGTAAAQSITSAGATVIFDTKDYDTTNVAYNVTTGVYTVQVPGLYKISAVCTFSSFLLGTNTFITMDCYKNGAIKDHMTRVQGIGASGALNWEVNGCTTVQCVVGDTLSIFVTPPSTQTLFPSVVYNHVEFERIFGPAQSPLTNF